MNITQWRPKSDAVHWYMQELSSRVVAQSGIPSDRHHLGKLILQCFKDAPDFVLQIDGATDEFETFSSALTRSVQCATAFRKLGLKHGDVIVLMAPNHIHLTIPMYAAFYLGIAVAGVDVTLGRNDLRKILNCNTPKMVFCQSERVFDVHFALQDLNFETQIVTFDKSVESINLAELLGKYGSDVSLEDFKVEDFDPADTISLLMGTSGTTGTPKSVAASHKNMVVSVPYLWITYNKFPSPTRLSVIFSPAHWYSALFQFVFSPILRHTRLQSSAPMTNEHAYYLINKYRPTFTMVTPNMLANFLKVSDRIKCDFTCFETIHAGGSAVHPSLFGDMKAASPNTYLIVNYGMTEVSGMAFSFDANNPDSLGKPLQNLEHRLVDPETLRDVTENHVHGELWLKGPGVFKGYYNNPEATAQVMMEGGWLKTGDLMYRDEQSYYYYVDRMKLLLVYKNKRISPLEIESVIAKHPGVFQVAVTGIPHEEDGDLPVACIVPHAGYKITAQEIKDLVKEMYRHVSDAIWWHLHEVTSRVVADSGIASDKYHIGKILLRCLKDAPDYILQIDGATDERDTFQSALERSVRCATGFRKIGLQYQDVVVVMAPNCIDLCIPIYAGLFLGIAVAGIDKNLGVSELRELLEITAPKIIFCENANAKTVQESLSSLKFSCNVITFGEKKDNMSFTEFLDKYADELNIDKFKPADFNPESTKGLLIPTSGSTGLPKFAALTHANIFNGFPTFMVCNTKFPTPFDLTLVTSPVQWISAILRIVLSPILRYTRLQTSSPVTPDHVFTLINKYKPEHIITSPTFMTNLFKSNEIHKCDFSSLKYILIGGSAVQQKVLNKIAKLIPNACTQIAYGLTEASGMVSNSVYSPPGSVGVPLKCYEFKLVDLSTNKDINEPNIPGELRLKGPGVIKEYHNNPKMTAAAFDENGWLKTGDILYRDEYFNFYFVDRFKLLLKYKSYQVSPLEIEKVIIKHPGVLDVAVAGIPDEECGELPVAFVIPNEGHNVTAQEIKDLVKVSLSDPKQLRGGVVFIKEMPTTSTFKIDRVKLKQMARNLKNNE